MCMFVYERARTCCCWCLFLCLVLLCIVSFATCSCDQKLCEFIPNQNPHMHNARFNILITIDNIPTQGVVLQANVSSSDVVRSQSSNGVGGTVSRFSLFPGHSLNSSLHVPIPDVYSFSLVFNASVGNRIKLTANKPFVLQLLLEFAESGADMSKMPATIQQDCFARVELVDLLDSSNRPLSLDYDWFQSDLATKIALINGAWAMRISGQSKPITTSISFSAMIITFVYLEGRQVPSRRRAATSSLIVQGSPSLGVDFPTATR